MVKCLVQRGFSREDGSSVFNDVFTGVGIESPLEEREYQSEDMGFCFVALLLTKEHNSGKKLQ